MYRTKMADRVQPLLIAATNSVHQLQLAKACGLTKIFTDCMQFRNPQNVAFLLNMLSHIGLGAHSQW